MKRLYRVSYSKPGRSGYRVNGHINVVTNDVVRAVQLTKQEHPDASIWSVDHLGKIDLIDIVNPEPVNDDR